MCLAIPAIITELKEDRLATVDILGVTREISVDLTPQAQLGDYVLVHAGFSIEVVSAEFAQETLDLINEFPELVEGDLGHDPGADGGGGRGTLQAELASLADEDFVSTGPRTTP